MSLFPLKFFMGYLLLIEIKSNLLNMAYQTIHYLAEPTSMHRLTLRGTETLIMVSCLRITPLKMLFLLSDMPSLLFLYIPNMPGTFNKYQGGR